MTTQANKKHRELHLEVGDWVLFKLQPYRQHSIALQENHKLGMCYFNLFQILHRIGEVSYQLQLPLESKIHPVFHISLLKPFKGCPSKQYILLPMTTIEEGPILTPAAILQHGQV